MSNIVFHSTVTSDLKRHQGNAFNVHLMGVWVKTGWGGMDSQLQGALHFGHHDVDGFAVAAAAKLLRPPGVPNADRLDPLERSDQGC
jgi:hypothetical protein